MPVANASGVTEFCLLTRILGRYQGVIDFHSQCIEVCDEKRQLLTIHLNHFGKVLKWNPTRVLWLEENGHPLCFRVGCHWISEDSMSKHLRRNKRSIRMHWCTA